MSKKADVTYKIELTFGSDRQRELHEPMRDGIINMLAGRFNDWHKKNIIRVKKLYPSMQWEEKKRNDG